MAFKVELPESWEIKEASGGEKVQNITPCNFSNCDEIGTNKYNGRMFCEHHYIQLTTLPNSKPPEPHKDCELCKHGRINRSGIPCETCSCWSNFEPIEDRLPGGTDVEPREDEGTISYNKGDIFITYSAKLNKIKKWEEKLQ